MRITKTSRAFKKWRHPVRGTSHAQVMDNAFWKWCVKTGLDAYATNRKFRGPLSTDAGPCWTFDRMGQAQVSLPDGRDIFIAGEHEDHYDPDFYIYNDVIIRDGEALMILGYPESDFPPTDFHSATLVGSSIWLIGNLGYQANIRVGETQVLRLDINANDESKMKWQISKIETSGDLPGWIYEHSATLNSPCDAIKISGGKRAGKRLTENFDDYELCLKTLRWRRLTHRPWEVWILERENQECNNLWDIRQAAWHQNLDASMKELMNQAMTKEMAEVFDDNTPEISQNQINKITSLYRSPVDGSEPLEDEDTYGRYRLIIQGIIVRVDEDMDSVTVTIEGELPENIKQALVRTFQERLSEIEGVKYVATLLD